MSKLTLHKFVKQKFNSDTINTQINEQEKVIASAEREIERLESIREDQQKLPWYRWDGISFEHEGWDHINGYCSNKTLSKTYKNYEEFASQVIKSADSDLRNSGFDPDHSVFTIVSPGQDFYDLNSEERFELPLVKEYFERKKLRKEMKKEESEVLSLDREIDRLAKEIDEKDKYTESYIESLQQKQAEAIKEREDRKEQLENGQVAQRLRELDELLVLIKV